MNWKELICKVTILGLLSLGVITSRVGSYIVTPLWLDFFNGFTIPAYTILNRSGIANSTQPLLPLKITSHSIGPQFIVFGEWGYCALVSGIILLWMLICCPATISRNDRNYPKLEIFIIGFCQALSSIGMKYASSGTKVAPYLQGILGNFNIPIQFTVRYVIEVSELIAKYLI